MRPRYHKSCKHQRPIMRMLTLDSTFYISTYKYCICTSSKTYVGQLYIKVPKHVEQNVYHLFFNLSEVHSSQIVTVLVYDHHQFSICETGSMIYHKIPLRAYRNFQYLTLMIDPILPFCQKRGELICWSTRLAVDPNMWTICFFSHKFVDRWSTRIPPTLTSKFKWPEWP